MKRLNPELVCYLKKLRTQGFAIVPGRLLMGNTTERKVRNLIREEWESGRSSDTILYDSERPVLRLWIDPFIEVERKFRRSLRKALRRERFKNQILAVRITKNAAPRYCHLHVDKASYITVLYAFGSFGTEIFVFIGGKIRKVLVPAGHALIISGIFREIATGIKAPVHRAQNRRTKKRVAVIFVYQKSGLSVWRKSAIPRRVFSNSEKRVGTVRKALRSRNVQRLHNLSRV